MQGLPCAPSFYATTTGDLLNVQGLPTGVPLNGLPCARSFNTIAEEDNRPPTIEEDNRPPDANSADPPLYIPRPPRAAAEEEEGEVYTQGEVYSGGGSAGLASAVAAAEVRATPPRNGGVATERDLESGSLLV